MQIGDRIRRARQAAGMSQRELAAALGVTHGLIGQWESQHKNPGRETLRRLAEVTLTSMEALLRDTDEAGPVLVQNPRHLMLLRRFMLMTERQQENLLELLGIAGDVARGSEERRHPAKQSPPLGKIHELTTR
jgi:transcriptional regulator with XRE-family HTH domain